MSSPNQTVDSNIFAGVTFVIISSKNPATQLRKLITSNGGKVSFVLNKQVTFAIALADEVERRTTKVQTALKYRIPIITEAYLTDSIVNGQKPNDYSQYALAQPSSAESSDDTSASLDNPTSLNLVSLSSSHDELSKSSGKILRDERQMKEIRIFVSSTFKDMGLEREQLVKQVFPELKQLCTERNVFFTYVDLRWGITQEETADGQTLNLCLGEIDKCQPYFICMIGERYGWSQTAGKTDALLKTTFSNAAAKYPWILQHEDKSITELEVRYAVLNKLASSPSLHHMRSFFYFRDPNFSRAVDLSERENFVSEGPEAAVKLAHLKSEIRATHLPVRDYKQPGQFAIQVLDDLRQAIQLDCPAVQNAVKELTTNSADYEAHLAFANNRNTAYVSNSTEYTRLRTSAFAQTTPIVVGGRSGSGKSALLANWFLREQAEQQKKFPDFYALTEEEKRRTIGLQCPPLIIAHFVASSPHAAEPPHIMRRIMTLARQHFGLPMSVPEHDGDVRSEFPHWIQAISEKGQVMLILDGVDHLSGNREMIQSVSKSIEVADDGDHAGDAEKHSQPGPQAAESGDANAKLLSWLPDKFPANFKVVVSSSPGSMRDHLVQVRKWTTFEVTPLSLEDRKALVSSYLSLHAKKLTASQMDLLANAANAQLPLFLRAILDELRISASFESLERHIRSYVASGSIPELYAKILARWEADYKAASKPNLIREALSLIAVSRRGLAENELLSLLQVTSVEWGRAMNAMQESLLNQGGLYRIYHSHLEYAVYTRYLDNKTLQELHQRLATFFGRPEKVSIQRKIEEYPYHLTQLNDIPRLRDCLLSITEFALLYTDKYKSDLFHYWSVVGEPIPEIVLSYFDSLHRYTSSNPAGDVLGDLLRQTARFMEELGEFEKANKIFHQALHADSMMYGQWHELVATDLYYLALTYFHMANFHDARNYAKQALDMRSNVMGIEHLDTIDCINLLAMISKKEGDYEKAKELFSSAVEVVEKTLGSSHAKLAVYLSNMGDVSRKLGLYEDAEKQYLRAKQIFTVLYGENSIEVSDINNNIGLVYKKKGAYEQALSTYSSALAAVAKIFGVDHVKYSVIAYNLADVHRKLDHFQQAEQLYRTALAIIQRVYGTNHPEVAEVYNDLGLLKKKEGAYPDAITHYTKAMSIIEQNFGLAHYKMGLYTFNLADAYRKLGQFDQADELYRKSLEIVEKVYGPNHNEVAEVLNSMGMVYKKRAMYDAAQPLYERALKIVQRSFGATHPKVAQILSNIGDLQRKRQNFESAFNLYRQALNIIRTSLGKKHSEAADVLNNMGLVQKELGNARDSIKLFNKALKIVRAEFGDVHPKIGMYENNLADAYFKVQELESAQKFFDRSLKMLEDTLGKNHIEVSDALYNCAIFDIDQKHPELARNRLQRAATIVKGALGEKHPKFIKYSKLVKDLETLHPALTRVEPDRYAW